MKFSLILIINISLCFSVMAQEALSLAAAIEKGIQNSYQVEIARQNLQIAHNNNNWGAAGRYPRVDFNINSSNSFTNSKNPGFLLEQSTLKGGAVPSIDASWTIFDGQKVKINKQQLEQVQNQSNTSINISIENTAQAVILAYYAVLIQEDQLKTYREVFDLSRDRIGYQEIRKEFGQAGKFDLLQTQDAFLNDSTNILLQKNNVATAYRNLNLAMGEDNLTTTYQLTDGLVYDTKNYDLENLETALFANNKQLQNLLINQELAHINTKFQESFKYPTVSIASGLSYDISGTDGTQTLAFGDQPPMQSDFGGTGKVFNYYLNLTASYNLYDGGAKKRNIENAKVEELIAQLNISDLKRNLSNQLQNALDSYNTQLSLVNLTENLIENARQNLSIAEERFRGGLINSFDYRSIQLAFVNASQARLNAIFNLKNTEVELLRLTGDLIK